ITIGRVNGARLTPELVAEINHWSLDNAVQCLYLLADPEPDTMRLAACAGFRFVDVRTTLEATLTAAAEDFPAVRPATPCHMPQLPAIAAGSHRNTRFYADGRFSQAACDELYRIWIGRDCAELFVAEREGRAVGYVTCHLEEGEGEIGLFAVGAGYR